jgi:hypothetical protein
VRTYGQAEAFEEDQGFWGPVVEHQGNLFVSYMIPAEALTREDVPHPRLEAVVDGETVGLQWIHVGGGMTDQGFVGYSVWQLPDHAATSFRLTAALQSFEA